jgi:hypothetical protein
VAALLGLRWVEKNSGGKLRWGQVMGLRRWEMVISRSVIEILKRGDVAFTTIEYRYTYRQRCKLCVVVGLFVL